MPFYCITRLELLYNAMMRVLLPNIAVAVRIELPDKYDGLPESDWLEAVIRRALAEVLPPDAAGQVSLLLTDDVTVRELNRDFRGVDSVTDVLSFSAEHSGHWMGGEAPPEAGVGWPTDLPLPDGEPPPLGDIVVSVPQANRQAEAQGVPPLRELALLIAHGALHLLGHDHYEDDERNEMQRLERAALAEIFGNTDSGGASAQS